MHNPKIQREVSINSEGQSNRLISEFSILGKQMNNELIVRSQDLTKTSIKKFAPKGTKKRKINETRRCKM